MIFAMQIEAIDLSIGDYIVPSYSSTFKKIWDDIGGKHELVETFNLEAMDHIPGTYP